MWAKLSGLHEKVIKQAQRCAQTCGIDMALSDLYIVRIRLTPYFLKAGLMGADVADQDRGHNKVFLTTESM
jgi:hypothetical protein